MLKAIYSYFMNFENKTSLIISVAFSLVIDLAFLADYGKFHEAYITDVKLIFGGFVLMFLISCGIYFLLNKFFEWLDQF